MKDNATFIVVPVLKTCNICGEAKLGREFYANSSSPDGLSYKCRDCSKRLNRENYAKQRGLIRRKARYAYKNDHGGRRTLMLAYQKAYRRANKEAVLAYSREYRKTGRPFINAKIAAYRKTDEGRFKQRQKQLRRQKELIGTYSLAEWDDLVAKYGRCLKCGTRAGECELTADHVVPIALGGENTIGNIQPLCRSCNSSKQAKFLDLRK